MTFHCHGDVSKRIIVVPCNGVMNTLGTPADQIRLHATLIHAFTDEKLVPSQPTPFRQPDKLLNTFLIHRSCGSFDHARAYHRKTL